MRIPKERMLTKAQKESLKLWLRGIASGAEDWADRIDPERSVEEKSALLKDLEAIARLADEAQWWLK